MPRQDFADCLDCQCLNARRTAARLTRLFDDRLRPHGLTANQFSLLSVLILAGPLTMSVLAERLGIERTTLTRNLALCGDRGWVSVRPGKDARARLVAISDLGRETAQQALPAWRAAQAAA